MEKEYTRRLDGFLGVDFSSSPGNVDTRRFTYLKNMYRDYESELGDAVETVPGFRLLKSWSGKVNGIFTYQPAGEGLYIAAHIGTSLYVFKHSDRDNLTGGDKFVTHSGLADAKSAAVMFNNKLFILDGTNYWVLDTALSKVPDDPYLPITYVNGEQYEQRNMLTNQTINRDTQMLEFDAAEILDTPDGTHYVQGWKKGYSAEQLIMKTSTTSFSLAAEAFKDNTTLKKAFLLGNGSRLSARCFMGCTSLVEAALSNSGDYNAVSISPDAFKNCTALKTVYLGALMDIAEYDDLNSRYVSIFEGCTSINKVYSKNSHEDWLESVDYGLQSIFPFATVVYNTPSPEIETLRHAVCYDPADSIASVMVDGEETSDYYKVYHTIDDVTYVDSIITTEDWSENEVDITLNCNPSKFNTYEGYISFTDGNDTYPGTTIEAITKCRLIASYDGRVFFSGNPNLPNTLFYTQRDLTGFANPLYVGVLNYVNDGTGSASNTALLATSGMLMVLKGDTVQDGSIYYHTGADTGSDIIPRTYPSMQGVAGIGCVGAAVNFRDDPVFLSRGGLEAVGKQQVNLERTITHRSLYVDRLLMGESLSEAVMCEWRKYLCIFCSSGGVYLADSRQLYEHQSGDAQYEWYFLDDVGVYAGQTQGYKLTTGRVLVGEEQHAVNLFDKEEANYTNGYGIASGGTIFPHQDYGYTQGYTPVNPSSVYTLRGNISGNTPNSSAFVACYSASKTFISRIVSSGDKITFTTPPDTFYVRFVSYMQNTDLDTWMLVSGTEGLPADSLTWLNDIEAWAVHDGVRKRLFVSEKTGYVPYEHVQSSFIYKAATGQGVWPFGDLEFDAEVAEYNGVLYLVEPDTQAPYSGGVFNPATCALSVDDVLYFGTSGGDICCFNTDKRGAEYNGVSVESDAIHHHWYTFNGRTINSCLSTAYDAGGFPDLAKSTVSKSMVIHSKVFDTSQFDVYTRTDRTDAWKFLRRISNSTAQFDDLSFSNLALKVSDETLTTVKEKEKKWAKKQYYLESNYHMAPFGMYHIGYRFTLTGRIRS